MHAARPAGCSLCCLTAASSSGRRLHTHTRHKTYNLALREKDARVRKNAHSSYFVYSIEQRVPWCTVHKNNRTKYFMLSYRTDLGDAVFIPSCTHAREKRL